MLNWNFKSKAQQSLPRKLQKKLYVSLNQVWVIDFIREKEAVLFA